MHVQEWRCAWVLAQGCQHLEQECGAVGVTTLGMLSSRKAFRGTHRAHSYVRLPPFPRVTVGADASWGAPGKPCVLVQCCVPRRKGSFSNSL